MKFSSKTYYLLGCFLCLNLALVRCDDEEEEIGSTEFGSKIEKPNTNNFKVSKKKCGIREIQKWTFNGKTQNS